MTTVQGEVRFLLFVGEGGEGGFDVGLHVVCHRHDEQRRVSEDACTASDGLECDAAIAFTRQGADFVVVVVCGRSHCVNVRMLWVRMVAAY